MESLRIPILKIGNVLIASIQTTLHDTSAVQFKDDLLQRIFETRARGLILDLTAVEVVDSFIGRLISDIAPQLQTIGGTDQPRMVERSMSECAPRAFGTEMCVQNPPTALNCRQWTTRQHCVTCTCMSMRQW